MRTQDKRNYGIRKRGRKRRMKKNGRKEKWTEQKRENRRNKEQRAQGMNLGYYIILNAQYFPSCHPNKSFANLYEGCRCLNREMCLSHLDPRKDAHSFITVLKTSTNLPSIQTDRCCTRRQKKNIILSKTSARNKPD